MKRGISPLISIVIIIGLVMVLAAIVFYFIGVFLEDNISRVSISTETKLKAISDLKIRINSANLVDISGNGKDDLRIIVENFGNVDIIGLKIRIMGTEDIVVIDKEVLIKPFEIKVIQIPNAEFASVGQIINIEIIPQASLTIGGFELSPEYYFESRTDKSVSSGGVSQIVVGPPVQVTQCIQYTEGECNLDPSKVGPCAWDGSICVDVSNVNECANYANLGNDERLCNENVRESVILSNTGKKCLWFENICNPIPDYCPAVFFNENNNFVVKGEPFFPIGFWSFYFALPGGSSEYENVFNVATEGTQTLISDFSIYH